MRRSGYSDDCDDDLAMGRWRGRVASAMRGKRGQAFLREMLEALDALPEKRLVAEVLEAGGAVCAIGSVGKARGIDMSEIDPEDYGKVAATFGIAEPMAQEIVYMNDEGWYWLTDDNGFLVKDEAGQHIKITPEARFEKMRAWIVGNLKPSSVSGRS